MKKRKNDTSQRGESPSRLIDARIKELGNWHGEMLSPIRSLIKQADPEVTEEVLFNSSFEGKARRAIDLHEGDEVDDSTFKALIRDAVALNTAARRG